MFSHKTSGIVLKGMNFGEADRILTVFTKRFGKVKAIAKGVRRIKSHLAGSLEPFQIVDLQLYEGKTFFTITGASIDQRFEQIHLDLKKTAQAFFLGELIDQFLQENQALPEVFDLLCTALAAVEEKDHGVIIKAFELKLLEASGFKPELQDCLHCKEKITPKYNYWDKKEGGLICSDCQQKFRHGHEISDQTIKALRFLEQSTYEEIIRLRLEKVVESEVEKILSEYITSVLEKEMKSQNFLNLVNL